MAKLRITYIGEYEAEPSDYLTDDPEEMAKIDQKSLDEGDTSLHDFMDFADTVEIKVEVVKA
jgi:hypothetical protein